MKITFRKSINTKYQPGGLFDAIAIACERIMNVLPGKNLKQHGDEKDTGQTVESI